MKPSFGTFQNFHHPCMFEALNIACQVKSPRSYRNDCQHIIYALAAPNVYRSRDVDVVLSNSDAQLKKVCFSKEGIQPCKSRCPKANALVWIMFGTLLQNQVKWTIFITDLCIAEMSSWVSCLTTVPIHRWAKDQIFLSSGQL